MEDKKEKKQHPVARFFYNVFVQNIGYKAIALGIALVIWVLVVGLGG